MRIYTFVKVCLHNIEKYLLAWRCLKKGYSVNKHDPNLMKIAIKFLVKMELVLPTLENEIVRKCLVYELTSHELFPKDIKDSTAYDVFSALLKSNIECVEYIVAACEVLIQVFDKIDEAKSLVEKLNRKRIPVPGYRSARFSTDSVELDKNLVPRVDELLKVLGLELPNLESLTI